MKIKKILLLEDHQEAQTWLLESSMLAFGKAVDVTVVDRVAEAIRSLKNQSYDLGIIDMSLPDGSGIDAIKFAKKTHPDMPCVVATIYSDDQHVFPALRAGAAGYFLKDYSREEIAGMLKDILSGKPPLSPEIAQKMLGYFYEKKQQAHPLTAREVEVLELVVKGLSARETAHFMGLSPHTVAGYLKEVYRKLHVSSRAEAAVEAVRLGIIRT